MDIFLGKISRQQDSILQVMFNLVERLGTLTRSFEIWTGLGSHLNKMTTILLYCHLFIIFVFIFEKLSTEITWLLWHHNKYTGSVHAIKWYWNISSWSATKISGSWTTFVFKFTRCNCDEIPLSRNNRCVLTKLQVFRLRMVEFSKSYFSGDSASVKILCGDSSVCVVDGINRN